MKRKFIEDAALVIDGRVASLKAELARDEARGTALASDSAAIAEAEFCARMIRSLNLGPYRDPYAAAYDHWNHSRLPD